MNRGTRLGRLCTFSIWQATITDANNSKSKSKPTVRKKGSNFWIWTIKHWTIIHIQIANNHKSQFFNSNYLFNLIRLLCSFVLARTCMHANVYAQWFSIKNQNKQNISLLPLKVPLSSNCQWKLVSWGTEQPEQVQFLRQSSPTIYCAIVQKRQVNKKIYSFFLLTQY